jgi:apolipoprotein N-acyltransferase
LVMKKLINRYENFESIIVGLFSATLFSAFIYLYNLGFDNKFINTVLALSAYYLLLHIPKKAVLASGFFIGIFWFYWISYSFKYNDSSNSFAKFNNQFCISFDF